MSARTSWRSRQPAAAANHRFLDLAVHADAGHLHRPGGIKNVSRLLHTPLMSLTNAISAIAVVGSIVLAGQQAETTFTTILGAMALACSMTNIVSGFILTDRMLKMFKKREPGKS